MDSFTEIELSIIEALVTAITESKKWGILKNSSFFFLIKSHFIVNGYNNPNRDE